MLKRLVTLLLCLTALEVNAQRKSDRVFEPLKSYDFSSGNFSLIFIPEASHDKEAVAYYTKNEKVLNAYKKGWIFDREAIVYPFACLDGYSIVLSQGGILKAGFALRLRCQAFVSDRDSWHINGLGTVLFRSSMNKAYRVDSTYESLVEARAALIKARQNPEVIFIPERDWEHYDGYFYFSRPNPSRSGNGPSADWETVLKEMEKKLLKEYAGQDFDLTLASHGSGKNYPQITFRVHSKKAFFDQFKIYPVTSWGWREFSPGLRVWEKK